MAPSALQVANTIIRRSIEQGRIVDQLKLQKLLYLAQGISLAVRGKPLFDDQIEAWQYGPVVRSVYRAAKKHGAAPIASTLPGVYFFGNVIPDNDKESLAIVEETLRAYGGFTGVQLVALTHRPTHPEGRPWVAARQRASSSYRSPVISPSVMRESFTELLAQPMVL